MSNKQRTKKIKPRQKEVTMEEQRKEKDNTLILSGLLVATLSIGLLVFVLSQKIFH